MWPLLLGFVSVYFFLTSIYRLYLHPLSKIPGPKIAALTWGYEFYYDVVRHGTYIWEVEKMHDKYGFLDDKNFKNEVRQAVTEMSNLIHVSKFFPMLATMFKAMPRWLVAKLRPGATAVLDMQDLITERYNAQKDETKTYKMTIFDALTDPSVPPEERSSARLADEGMILMIGGTETTARVLSTAAFQLYQDEHLLESLRKELRPVMPTPTSNVSWSELEQLPLLNGLVNESLRLAFGSTIRSPRVAPTESLQYKGLVIPPGSPISMSPYFVLTDPEIFPEPESFRPERWIEAAQKGQNLNRYLVAFSRGSRNCLGMNLAYAELYMTIAAFVRRFDLEIFETTAESIRPGRDLGMAQPKEGKFAVRAKVTNVIKE
ncbi:MAG: hypothetical protein OHK93_001578 [Ramalina farinacea]|uniref:Cytochrome P450 n=1 Tax=Ramalina farinacea TaxID=258253 RepID=A0AA43QSJ4_9LECA|nr:hypothetical protein [Ramalina farinacea]